MIGVLRPFLISFCSVINCISVWKLHCTALNLINTLTFSKFWKLNTKNILNLWTPKKLFKNTSIFARPYTDVTSKFNRTFTQANHERWGGVFPFQLIEHDIHRSDAIFPFHTVPELIDECYTEINPLTSNVPIIKNMTRPLDVKGLTCLSIYIFNIFYQQENILVALKKKTVIWKVRTKGNF